MADRSAREYLADIVEYCDRILGPAGRMTLEHFRDDLNAQDAFARRYEVIGEAVKRLPSAIRDAYPDVEWRQAAAFRDMLAHHYVDLEIDILYLTAQNHLPSFRAQVAQIVSDLDRQAAA